MILTCPECATRYFVGDDQVGASGRTVKCAACGNRWTAHREPDLELSISGDEGALAHEPEALKPEPAPLDKLPGEELPKAFRAKAQNEKKVREAATVGVVWAGMTAALLVLVGGSFVMRENVVRIWPQTASVFAAVNGRVNMVGLEIEDIRAEPALQDGHAALSVSGVIRNVRARTVTAPPLQISLINKENKRVMAKIAQAADPSIPAGETRHFAVVLLDPPKTASTLEVSFVTDKGAAPGKAKAPVKKTHEETSAKLRGPAEPGPVAAPQVEEAHPLAPDDPNALPNAASGAHPAEDHH
ncbi:MAG: zinc-ribbon domain-containing protein [Caulobacter sp.]|nr:zinc-ribbon domain-containing protein [Caulobacter sp.]